MNHQHDWGDPVHYCKICGDCEALSVESASVEKKDISRTYTQPGEKLQTFEQVKDFVRLHSPKAAATPIQRAEAWSHLCELLGIEW